MGGTDRRGAWGWQWHGFDNGGSTLNSAPPGWPDVAVTVSCGGESQDGAAGPPQLDARRAAFAFSPTA